MHGTIIQAVDGDGRTLLLLLLLLLLLFIELCYVTHWDNNKLHQNSSSLLLTANTGVSLFTPTYQNTITIHTPTPFHS